MKKYPLLLFLHIKSAFMSLPKILAATLAFSIIVGLAGFAGTKLLYNEDTIKPMDIALVLPEDSEAYTLAAFTFLGEIDTVKDLCSFTEMPEEEAFAALKDGRVAAVILIPGRFIEHIMNGTNTPAEVILPKSGLTSGSPLFRELVNAGVGDLAVAQAGIYAVDDACVRFGLRNGLADAETYLNEIYLSYSLNRNAYFQNETVLSTGSLTIVQFYFCTAMVLLIMFSSVSCIHLLKNENKSLNLAFLRKGISPGAAAFSKAFAVSLMFFAVVLTAILCCVIISAFSPDAAKALAMIAWDIDAARAVIGIILIFIAIFNTVFIAQTILAISDNILAEITLLFLLTLVMMFVSGAFIPSALLPEILQNLSVFMPLSWILRLWGNVVTGTVSIIIIIANAVICCICAAVQHLLIKIKS